MENVAYSKEYGIYFREQEAVFREDYLRHMETMVLSSCYSLKKRSYCGEVGKYTLHGTENELMNESGAVLYTWRNLDDNCEFCKIIEHSDGCKYLIFRSDLYGYSVLNLSTLQDFHYIPSGSFPKGETFIWTDVFYNEKNNLIAVSGCYWACPFGTLLLDFTYPMKNPGVWVDVSEQMDDGYEQYDDLDFVEWRNTELVLSAFNNQTGIKETISFSEDHYMKWLAEK